MKMQPNQAEYYSSLGPGIYADRHILISFPRDIRANEAKGLRELMKLIDEQLDRWVRKSMKRKAVAGDFGLDA